MHGIIVLDKPAGISSASAVNRVKRLLPRGTKIGHAGTLDPFATGVLLLLIGKATKSCEALMDQPKKYESTIKLGATTETDDPESPEILWGSREEAPSPHDVSVALQNFVGSIEQVPPRYSALKVKGKRACDRVRAGETIEMKPRTVRIDSIELLDYSFPFLRITVACGRGTYIRSLARDLGSALNCGGYLTELRRTAVGAYGAAQLVTLEKLSVDGVLPHLKS